MAWPLGLCTGGYRRPLAARAVSQVLGPAIEAAAPSPRPARYRGRGAPIDPTNGGRQSAVASPRIHGELKMLGITISERTVSRILRRLRRPPSQTWKTFLHNHIGQLVSIDFFTVPTVTMRVLFVFIVLEHAVGRCYTSMSPRIPPRPGRPNKSSCFCRSGCIEISDSRSGHHLRQRRPSADRRAGHPRIAHRAP